MARSADYKCADCGKVREFVFNNTPPASHFARCCVPLRDKDGTIDDVGHSRFARVWTAPHMGRMSSGEPPR